MREERAPGLAAVNGGLAFAAAIFSIATAAQALGSRALSGGPSHVKSPTEDVRESLERISRIAQAGALGDANAAQHAFAMIARRTRESLEALPDR